MANISLIKSIINKTEPWDQEAAEKLLSDLITKLNQANWGKDGYWERIRSTYKFLYDRLSLLQNEIDNCFRDKDINLLRAKIEEYRLSWREAYKIHLEFEKVEKDMDKDCPWEVA